MKFVFLFSFVLTFSPLGAQDVVDSVLYHHAISAPEDYEMDIVKLSEYLLKPAKTDRQKIQVVSYWITDNIEYDMTGYFTESYDDTSWSNTLETKKAVCQGYSELFKEFCDLMEVECYIVSGYAKGYGYVPGFSFQETDHAWNVVAIDGKYELFDVTWASGSSSFYDSALFMKQLDVSYLFADPVNFVEEHLPAQTRWQLLNFPVSIDKYEDYVEASDMIDSLGVFYNFADSIAAYRQLDENGRKMLDLEERYRVLPSELNLAFWNLYKGYELSYGEYDEERLTKSLELSNAALKILSNSKYADSSFTEYLHNSIQYVRRRLNNKS